MVETCPLVPEHGSLHAWNKPPSFFPWWCPHQDHGGNGLFYTEETLLGAKAMSKDLQEVVPAVISGDMTVDAAAEIIARRSNTPIALARQAIETRVRTARNYADAKAARQTTVYKPQVRGVPLTPSSDPSYVPPTKFMEVMLAKGLTKKQAAEAIDRSVSRVHELTVTQGGKQHLFDNFVKSLEAYGGQAGGSGSGSSKEGN